MRITVKGTVQGVGFRPFVYRLARENRLSGTVANTSAGVVIQVSGEPDSLARFRQQLAGEAPPLARIDRIDSRPIAPFVADGFSIIASAPTASKEVILPPDVTICPDCERELRDPQNRRYAYPLNNCTNCGPRYTIIRSLPYDRPATALGPFPLCEDCLREYRDPANRRYHAEATSCPACGPRIRLTSASGELIDSVAPVAWLAGQIAAGKIVAVQGVGGFHLICDALAPEAVATLRRRKNRPAKPFAVMAGDFAMAEQYGVFDATGRALLESIQRPVVIVPDRGRCCPQVTGGLDRIGLFLPYTPLHQLLFRDLDRPIVATSANIADEPIIIAAETLRARLGTVVDFVLEFEREIVNGCDDSVVTVAGESPVLLRRARGYAPAAFKLPEKLSRRVLAVGADQKNTLGLGLADQAILSPHIGDLQSLAAQRYFEETLASFSRLYDFRPDLIVCDRHPGYRSTAWAREQGITVHAVQHHYAHALAGMVAGGLGPDSEILAVCWDGTGYGDDGTIWGGEFLSCSYHGYQRVAHLRPFRLPGGEKAVREPRRSALGLLFELFGAEALPLDHHCLRSWTAAERDLLRDACRKQLNAPLTSSAGRLFDAAAALLDICQVISYEGESGLRMEKFYDPGLDLCYRFELEDGVIDCAAAFQEMLGERDPVRGATGFINMLAEVVFAVMAANDRNEALLTGGVFQNSRLLERLFSQAPRRGCRLLLPADIPCNDGGIALGQIASALYHGT